jgi:hypothetical protein
VLTTNRDLFEKEKIKQCLDFSEELRALWF